MVEIKAIIGEREKHTIEAYYSTLTAKFRILVDGKEIVSERPPLSISTLASLYKFNVGEQEKHDVELMCAVGPTLFFVVDGKEKIENQKEVSPLLKPAHESVEKIINRNIKEGIDYRLILILGLFTPVAALAMTFLFGAFGFLLILFVSGLGFGISTRLKDIERIIGSLYISAIGTAIWFLLGFTISSFTGKPIKPISMLIFLISSFILGFFGAFVGKILKGKSPSSNVS